MTEEIVAWGWEQWWGHCDTNDLVHLWLPVMITGIGLGDHDLMHDDGKHGAYLFIHCDVSPLYLHYGLRANSVWSWPSVHNPSSMLYLVFASQLHHCLGSSHDWTFLLSNNSLLVKAHRNHAVPSFISMPVPYTLHLTQPVISHLGKNLHHPSGLML